MLFSSISFIFYFLPAVLAIYYIIPKKHIRARNVVLLCASLIFYSWGEPVYVLLMMYSAFFNYYLALCISREMREGGSGRHNLIFAVAINLFILFFFKYSGFFVSSFNRLTGFHIPSADVALPIGVSFYTFQALSYIFDVYRRKTQAQTSLTKFALYLSLFPQLIAGPIVKYRDVSEQLDRRKTSIDDFGYGTSRFITGLGKKVLLANAFGELFNYVTDIPVNNITVVTAWIGAVAYTMQIYFDFSGYSDMAIGLGRMFGFRFSENFLHPYISRTVTEFWRRWHVSLSGWFREYVYIPLGGSRVTPVRHIINLLTVWILTGLWHGAGWNFVFWGLYYGIILITEKYFLSKYLDRLPAPACRLYTMLVVITGWVFFSSSGIGPAFRTLGIMAGIGASGFADMTSLYLIRTNFILIITGCIFSTRAPGEWFNRTARRFPVLCTVILCAILLLSVASLIFSSYNPFLYFRF